MQARTQERPSTAAPGDESRTLTITNDPVREDEEGQGNDSEGGQAVGTLKLRGKTKEGRTQRVAWDEDVVDNEGFGRKKTKSILGFIITPLTIFSDLLTLIIFSLLYLSQTEEIRRILI
jgi:hypothetical protein